MVEKKKDSDFKTSRETTGCVNCSYCDEVRFKNAELFREFGVFCMTQ